MRRLIPTVVLVLAIGAVAAPLAWAGSPHFVGAPEATRTDNTLTVSGKEAGLGDEQQVNIVLKATALCINGGGHHPKAVNKQSLSTEENVPVQNGKANFTLSVTASFSPSCSPPMTVVFTDVSVTDTTNGITAILKGTF